MYLVLAVLFREEELDDILSAFAELGLENAVVVDGIRMQDVLAFDVLIFAGLGRGSHGQRRYAKVIVATTEEPDMGSKLANLARDLQIDFSQPDVGFIATLRLDELVSGTEELRSGDE